MFWTSDTGKGMEQKALAKLPATTTKRPEMKIGIAFGAGAAKGWAHIGVIKRLEEAGIVPDVIAGTSIGALAGGCYAAGKLDGLEAFARSLTRRRVFSLLDFSWRGSGLITGNKLGRMLTSELGETQIEDLKHPVHLYCHRTHDRPRNLAAGRKSGGRRESVLRPARRLQACLYERHVAARRRRGQPDPGVGLPSHGRAGGHCRQPEHGFVRNRNRDPGARLQRCRQRARPNWIMPTRRTRPATPFFTSCSAIQNLRGSPRFWWRPFNISQDRLARSRLAGDPPDILVSPKTPNVGLFDFDKAADSIDAGWEAADRALPEIELAMETLRMPG